MKDDWTRIELTDALFDAQMKVPSGVQWEAIMFCIRMLAAKYPDPHKIITDLKETSNG